MSDKSANRSFIQGALILSVATAIVKIIGAIFKIPLGNLIGEEGYGHFNVAYNLYNVLLVLSTAGLPVALSKMVSESNTHNRNLEIKRTVSVARLAFLCIGIAGTSLMFFFSDPLASMMGDTKAGASIMALAPAVLFVSLMSTYRGYFQGMSDMLPTAISQVIEALCKLLIGFSLAWWLLSIGQPLEIASAGAIGGVAIGSGLGFLYIYITSKRRGRRTTESAEKSASRRQLFRRLLSLAVPITLGASVLSLVNFIDAVLVLNRLQDSAGFTEKLAVSSFGAYGYAQNMFNLPGAFIVTIAVSVIPAISAALSRRDTLGAARTTESALRITMLLSLPAGLGLTVLSNPILSLLYPELKWGVAVATPLLSILGIAVIFNGIVLVSNAILQSYGKVNLPVISMAVGGAVKIVTNYILVGDPNININGAPIGTTACYGVIALLNIIFLLRQSEVKLRLAKVIVRPLAAALIMAGAAWSINAFLARFISPKIGVLIAVAVAGVIYLVMVVLLRAVTREDLRLIPKGEKLANKLNLK